MKAKIQNLFVVLTICCLMMVAGCAANGGAGGFLGNAMNASLQQQTAQAPGIYDLTAWNGIRVSNTNPNAADNQAESITVEKLIDEPFFLSGPKATIKPTGWTWTEHVQIVQGTLPPGSEDSEGIVQGALPPGLNFDSNFNITGTPTKAGTYHLTIRVDNIQCTSKPNFTYYGFQQQITIIIAHLGFPI